MKTVPQNETLILWSLSFFYKVCLYKNVLRFTIYLFVILDCYEVISNDLSFRNIQDILPRSIPEMLQEQSQGRVSYELY